jgi:hypothetical protein
LNNFKGIKSQHELICGNFQKSFKMWDGISLWVWTHSWFEQCNIKHATKECLCVALEVNEGWEVVVLSEITKKAITILVDYDCLPILCKFCMKFS